MAMQMQKEHRLRVIAVRLLQEGLITKVRFSLIDHGRGFPDERDSKTVLLDQIRVSGRAGTDPLMTVPQSVVKWITDWAEQEVPESAILWIHLVKPYGDLGAVPWERSLVPALRRPLLRIPDVLPSPRSSSTTFSVALIASALEESTKLPVEVAKSLADGLGQKLVLHYFGGELQGHTIARELEEYDIGGLEFHPLFPSNHGRTSEHDNLIPWLRWIRDRLSGRAVDAVHFIAHGANLGMHGALLTPSSTQKGAHEVLLEAVQLEPFITQTGALVVGFTRPFENWSDYGLRLVADDIGAHRAGPVVLHDPEIGDPSDLAACYHFLADAKPGSPPMSPGLQLYAQPRQVRAADLSSDGVYHWTTDENDDWFTESNGKTYEEVPSPVQDLFDRKVTPRWVAAAQRYLEQQEAQLMRFEDEKLRRTPTAVELAHFEGIRSALSKAQRAIQNLAERA